jgi:hypothetical protein
MAASKPNLVRPKPRASARPSRIPVMVEVPFLETELAPVVRERVRALKRNLVEAMRELRKTRKPERLIQSSTPAPVGFAATVTAAGCANCQGFCCKNGGDHAYIDDRTMARVRHDRPELDAAAVIRMYVDAVPAEAARGSCIFHGAKGCTLARDLRAELCNTYYCTGLHDFLNWPEMPPGVVVVASRNGKGQRSNVLRPPSPAAVGPAADGEED